MALPKSNTFIKGIYLFAVLCMFAFMMVIIRAYWPDEVQMASWNEAIDSPVNQAQTPEQIAKTTTENLDIIQSAKKEVVGITYQLNLSKDVASQINDVWRTFYNDDALHTLNQAKSKREVYLVYVGHDESSNTVELALGYLSKSNMPPLSSKYKRITLPSGRYLQSSSVLDTWENADQLSIYLNYHHDYEIYTLDRDYNILTQTAYLSVKS